MKPTPQKNRRAELLIIAQTELPRPALSGPEFQRDESRRFGSKVHQGMRRPLGEPLHVAGLHFHRSTGGSRRGQAQFEIGNSDNQFWPGMRMSPHKSTRLELDVRDTHIVFDEQ